MGGVDAEDIQLVREEAEFLERQQQAVFRMALDIGIELRRVNAPPTM